LEAVMNRPTTLEQTIAAALGNPNLGSAELSELISEVEGAAASADQTAKQEHAKAIDLTLSPDPKAAHERVVESEIFCDRLHHAIPQLRDKLTEALAAEAKERWWADYKRVKVQLAARLVEIFRMAQAVDQEVGRIAATAPDGEHRRLKPVELEARGLDGFTRDNPSLAKTLQLPDPEQPGKFVWPPREASLAVQVAMGMTHPGADWFQESKQRSTARREEHARVIDHYDAMAREREERENAEATKLAARARARGGT
jgi:hypothetical protein